MEVPGGITAHKLPHLATAIAVLNNMDTTHQPDNALENASNSSQRTSIASDIESDAILSGDDGFEIPSHLRKRKRQADRRSSSSSSGDDTVRRAASSARTVLFRPAGREGSVAALPFVKLEEFLNSEAPNELTEIRINRAMNIVAVDVKTSGGVNKLLALSRLCTFTVRASLPAPKSASVGVIRVQDVSLGDAELSQRLRSSVPVFSVKRMGKASESVRVIFCAARPHLVHIGSVKCPVSDFRARPTQCFKCGRFGHLGVSCTNAAKCLKCAGDHDANMCDEGNAVKCSNCGLSHSALDRTCRVKQLETAARRYSLKEHVPTPTARQILKKKETTDSHTGKQRGDVSAAEFPPHGVTVRSTDSGGGQCKDTSKHEKPSYSEAVKGTSSPNGISRATTSNDVQRGMASSQDLPKKSPTQNSTTVTPPSTHTQQSSPPSVFTSLIRIAFSVLRAIVQCPSLPTGLTSFLSLVIPLEQTLAGFFKV